MRPRSGHGGIAAAPGHSNHNRGLATDVPSGPFRDWLYRHGHGYGLHFPLGPKDPPHMQMDPRYSGPSFQRRSTDVAKTSALERPAGGREPQRDQRERNQQPDPEKTKGTPDSN